MVILAYNIMVSKKLLDEDDKKNIFTLSMCDKQDGPSTNPADENLGDGCGLSQGLEQQLKDMGDDEQAGDLCCHSEDGVENFPPVEAISIFHVNEIWSILEGWRRRRRGLNCSIASGLFPGNKFSFAARS